MTAHLDPIAPLTAGQLIEALKNWPPSMPVSARSPQGDVRRVTGAKHAPQPGGRATLLITTGPAQ